MVMPSGVTAAVDGRRRERPGSLLVLLPGLLLGVVAGAAVAGGIGLMRDGMGMPSGWADRLPFHSWVFGGIALLVGVAIPQTLACGAVLFRHRRASLAAAAAGVLLVGWILVELLVLREYSVLQPVIAAMGLLETACAWWWCLEVPIGSAGRTATRSGPAPG